MTQMATAIAALHAAKIPEVTSSPPSDAPTPLPPPMPTIVSSSSPCTRGSPYERQTLYRPSSREGMLARPSSREGMLSQQQQQQQHSQQQHPTKRGTTTQTEEIPVRDTIPTSMWCSTVETSLPQVKKS